jgi:hypothetical protein
VNVVCKEQSAGIRKALQPVRTGAARYDVAKVLKAVLVREDFVLYLKTKFPKMSYLIDFYLSPEWYAQTFQLSEASATASARNLDDDAPDAEQADQQTQSDSVLSSYSCHPLLKGLLERLMRNGHEGSMCRMSGESIPGKHLMLTSLDESISVELSKISEKYTADFPATATSPDASPSSTVIVDSASQTLEVVTRRVLEDDKDYRTSLAEYNSLASKIPNCNLCLNTFRS